MKKLLIIPVILFLFIPFIGASDTGSVAIVYNGVSGVNRESLQYIRKEASKVDREYTFEPVRVSSGINMEWLRFA